MGSGSRSRTIKNEYIRVSTCECGIFSGTENYTLGKSRASFGVQLEHDLTKKTYACEGILNVESR